MSIDFAPETAAPSEAPAQVVQGGDAATMYADIRGILRLDEGFVAFDYPEVVEERGKVRDRIAHANPGSATAAGMLAARHTAGQYPLFAYNGLD